MIVKTEKERVILREGGKRLAAILERAAAQCVPGAVLSEINDTTAAYMKEFGLRKAALSGCRVRIGERWRGARYSG